MTQTDSVNKVVNLLSDNRNTIRRKHEYAHRVVDIYAGEKTVGKMAKKFDSDNLGYLDDSNWIIKVEELHEKSVVNNSQAKQVQQRNQSNLALSECADLGCEAVSECETLTEDQCCPIERSEKDSIK